jgi:hypothetical protein
MEWRGVGSVVAWRGAAWPGVARRAGACRGAARCGLAWLGVALRGVACRGSAGRGLAWPGLAWRDKEDAVGQQNKRGRHEGNKSN